MKAVVLEKRFCIASVLKEDGTFSRMITSAGIGQEIYIREGNRMYERAFKTAAAFLLVMMISLGAWNYMMVDVCAYVTVDTDPSIEFSLNRLDRVTAVVSSTDEGQEIAARLEETTKGMTLEQALSETREVLKESKYINEDEEASIQIEITGTSPQKAEKLKERAKSAFTTENAEISIQNTDLKLQEKNTEIISKESESSKEGESDRPAEIEETKEMPDNRMKEDEKSPTVENQPIKPDDDIPVNEKQENGLPEFNEDQQGRQMPVEKK